MKKILFFAALLMSLSTFAQTDKDVQFTSLKYSFGKIPKDKPVTTEFKFVNNSSKPLIIENATAECGCTSPEYSKAPVLKGKSGTIKVTYNAANEGQFLSLIHI